MSNRRERQPLEEKLLLSLVRGEKVLAAVSGGADSMALLDALRALEEENVVLSFNGPVSPFILQNQGVKESLYLILPVRNAA